MSIASYARRLGVALDVFLNVVLFDGDDVETISVHAAEARNAGRRWGCILCMVLGVLVQRHHCTLALTNEQTPPLASARAALLMLALIAVIWWICHTIVHML